jgi:hypothetical protein
MSREQSDKHQSFGREPQFEGADVGAVRNAVTRVSRSSQSVIQVVSLVFWVVGISTIGCMAVDMAGLHSIAGLDFFLSLGRFFMAPLAVLAPAVKVGHAHFDWAGLGVLAWLVALEACLRWASKRFR